MLPDRKETLQLRATIRRDRPLNTWMRLLAHVLALAQNRGELVRNTERAWASATFCGARHTIVLAFDGAEGVAAGETFIAALPDHEFDVPGYLVADASVREVNHAQVPEPRLVIELELLLLEDL